MGTRARPSHLSLLYSFQMSRKSFESSERAGDAVAQKPNYVLGRHEGVGAALTFGDLDNSPV